MRTCIGCRRRAPAEELVRFALVAEGRLALDRGAPGRGAWICVASGGPDAACLDQAIRKGAFARALRRAPAPGAESALRATVRERETMVERAAGAAHRGRD